MSKRILLLFVLLVISAGAFAQTITETFNSRIGPTSPTYAITDRFGAMEVSGGGYVYGNFYFGTNNTAYVTVGPYIDQYGFIRESCQGCAWIGLGFDQKVQSLSFDAFNFDPGGIWTFEAHPSLERYSVRFETAGVARITIPFRNFTHLNIFGPDRPFPPPAPQPSGTWAYGIDNVSYSFTPPVRIVTGPDTNPNSQAVVEKLVTPNLSIRYPLGRPFFIKVQEKGSDNVWRDIRATYAITETPVAPSQMAPRLWPSRHVFQYGQAMADFKAFQTVHLGTASIRVLPDNRTIPTFDIKLDIVRPSFLSSTGSQWDSYIVDIAEETGIPPQYLKAQIQKESTFAAQAYRYEPRTVDLNYMHWTYINRTGADDPWRNYILREVTPVHPEGHHLCPTTAFSNGTPAHDCAFSGLDDLSPRNKYKYCDGTECKQLTDAAGFNTPITIRQIVNANAGMAALRDPAPQYGATLSGTEVTASGRRRRACCTPHPPPPDPLNVTAQTPMAASYGLLQFVAAFLPDAPYNWPGVNAPGRGARFNPSLLFDDNGDNRTRRSASLIVGARKDVQSYLSRTRRAPDDVSFDHLGQFDAAMEAMFAGYNPNDNTYAPRIMSYYPNHLPTLPFGSFPAIICNSPVIVHQSAPLALPPGDSGVVSVTIDPDLHAEKFTWYEGATGDKSRPVPGGDWSFITVSPSAPTSYWVEVITECGATKSGAIPVTFRTPCASFPSISQQPTGAHIAYNGSAVLRVAASNAASYQWYKGVGPVLPNGEGDRRSPIAGATGPELHIDDLTATTPYWVLVSSACSSVGSQTATVEVDPCVTPSVSVQATPSNITNGASVTLTASATGTTPRTFKWFANGVELIGKTTRSITATPSITTTYLVAVSNDCGTDTASTTVTVCTPASITGHPQNATIIKGQSAPLSVTASGTAPLSYQWYADGTPIDGNSASISVSPSSSTTYSVVVTNACGSVTSNPATVTVTADCVEPSIDTPPASSAITRGQSASLSVIADGSSPLTYQWFTAGGAVVGSGATMSVAPDVTTSYFARVSNSCGAIDSAMATVTVTVPPDCTAPAVVSEPVDTTITAGQTARLSVTADGTAPLSYQWLTSAGTPAGSNTAVLTVSPTSTTSYYVRVSNACGNAQSATATVTVNAACTTPTIASQPVSTTIAADQTATLSVSANGTAPLSYQWFTSAGTPAGSTAETLTVAPASTTSYYVAVSNACGNVQSTTATVSVCKPPAFTSQPSNKAIDAGQSTTLTGTLSGTTPMSYQWYDSSGMAITDAVSNSITVTPSTTTSYYLRAWNDCGSVQSTTVTVTVCALPNITSSPRSTVIDPGESTTLSVTAGGTAPLSYQWYQSPSTLLAGETSETLTVTPSSTTSYYVAVTNSCGTDTSNTATVTVYVCEPPSIAQQPVGMTITAGQPATITCLVYGSPTLSRQWYENGVAMPGRTAASTTVYPTQTTTYHHVVTNGCGQVTSNTITVTVLP